MKKYTKYTTGVFRGKMNEREKEKTEREKERREAIVSQTKSHPEVKKGRGTNRERSKKTAR